MDGLWGNLPSDLLERALPFLPVLDLCRFRSVCRRWNSLICTPEFGTLCAQSASKDAIKGACLVVKLRVFSTRNGRLTEIPSWSILDLNAKRWYNIKHGLPEGSDYDVSAMDGGLVCTFVNAFTDGQLRLSTLNNPRTNQPQTLIISNLIGKSIEVLPNPPLVHVSFPHLNLKLVVDSISQTYKIFLICVGRFWNPGDPCMCVYESSTKQWRIPPNPPNPPYPDGKFGADVRSAVFKGLLYVLFSSKPGFIHRLYSYNVLEDAWDDTGVQFRQCKLDLCDLVVSDNRLFLMTQRLVHQSSVDRRLMNPVKLNKKTPWPLDLSEISLADKVCRTVVHMTEAEVLKKFSIDSTRRCGSQNYEFKIRAFGFDKSILLMCGETGKVRMYNLVTGVWDLLRPNPLERPHLESISNGLSGSLSRYGKQMNYLRLPNTPWG